ncbi:MAG: trigger factor [Eubacteriales bacterium]|nr:trigger factor [bacterium]MDY2792044.1 trigger factor [Eubacteriales bacterium]
MKSTMEKLSSNKVKLDFVVEAARFDEAMEKAYRKNRSRINVPGFRKGKAPRKVIEMQFGEGVFYEDAIDELFPSVYSEAIKEHGIEPVDRPEFDLKTIGSGKDLEFSVEVFVKPDVTLGQYKGVAVHKNHTEVTEDDVKAEIERARERASRYIDIDGRAAKLDDQVTIDYEGECDGEKFEGGSAKDYRLVLGSGNFIPGFEDQLVGAEVGSTVDVNVTFPEDYHAENLKGKKATFKVTVKAIQEKDVPALDDEFAKDVSEFDTLEEYKKDLTEKMTKSAQQRDDYAFENDVIEKVTENATVDIPAAMVEERVDERINEFAMNMRRQGLDMDTYMKYTGQTMDAMRETLKEGAEKDVKTRLVLEAICDAEKIEPTKEEVDAEIEKYAENMGDNKQKFIDSLTDSDRSYFEKTCKMLKTIEMLKDSAVEPEA